MEARQASTSTEIGGLNTSVKALRSESTESMLELGSLLKSIQDPLTRSMVQISALSESVVGGADKQERQEILRWLSNIQFINETLRHPNAAPIACFYCGRSSAEPQRSDATEVLRAILKQLMCCDPKWQIDSTVAKEYKSRKQEAEKDESDIARLDIDETTQKIIDITAKPPTTIFIDALDECWPEERYRLLRALDILLDESVHLVKVFVSSRDNMDIVIKLQQNPNIYINIKDNKIDIDKFARVEVEKAIRNGRLLNGQVTSELQNHITTSLQEKANGMLEEDLRHELQRLPRSLDEMYSLILDKTLHMERFGLTVAEMALRWLLYAIEAGSMITRALCAAASSMKSCDLSIQNILDTCSNLVSYDKRTDTFRFAHLSVREFLESKPGYGRGEATISILKVLNKGKLGEQSIIGHLRYRKWCRHVPELLSLKTYALRYWAYHFNTLDEQNKRIFLSMI
ncbi:MAG: hypothetical protein Q9167_003261 [Letrouitia subvulpina]